MSDEHHGLPHDLPRPPAKVRVFKDGGWWRYEHRCAYRGPQLGPLVSYPQRDHGMALRQALRHLAWCS